MDSILRLYDRVNPAVMEIWDEQSTELSRNLEYTKLGFGEDTPDFPTPLYTSTSSFAMAMPTAEGEMYNRDDRVQGYDVTPTLQKYTQVATITEEMIHWKNSQKMLNELEGVKDSLQRRIDTEVAKIFYLGFGTTNFTGGDGKALFAYDHPATGQGVAAQRNIFQTTEGHMALNEASFELAVQRLGRFYDNKGGQLMPLRRLKLIVAPENEQNAQRIVGSPLRSGTANNDQNVWLNQRVEVVVSNYIPAAYSTYWFLVDADRMDRFAKVVWGWKPELKSDGNVINGTLLYTGSTILDPIFYDWRFAFGSKGDLSTISS